MDYFTLDNLISCIGYLGSVFILGSFLFNDLKKVRVINLIGCTLFAIYGILINAIPIIIPNVGIAIIQIYYLFIKKSA